MQTSVMQTIVSMKWGTRYGADYVNRLWSMIKRNTTRPTRLICYTDDSSGVDPEVECMPQLEIELPENLRWLPWRKIALWDRTLPGLSPGDPALFVDLDIVVTGNLDSFFTFEPQAKFCVIRNWTQMEKNIGNTTCFRFQVGMAPEIMDDMVADPIGIWQRYRNEQRYISAVTRIPMTYWPEAWCASFKHGLLPRWPLNFVKVAPLPPDTRLVAFTGKPDPDEARDGRWPAPWYKKTYKHVRPTPWIAENWR